MLKQANIFMENSNTKEWIKKNNMRFNSEPVKMPLKRLSLLLVYSFLLQLAKISDDLWPRHGMTYY